MQPDLRAPLELARLGRQACAALRQAQLDRLESGGMALLGDAALYRLETIARGVRISLRADELAAGEARRLAAAARIRPEPSPFSPAGVVAAARRARATRDDIALADRGVLMAGFEGRLVLASIPRLPAELASWPAPPAGYWDIARPRSGGELLARLDEMAEVCRRLGGGQRGSWESMRRTYAFFETAAWFGLAEQRRLS